MIDWKQYEYMKPRDDDAYLAEAIFSQPDRTVGHVQVHAPTTSLAGSLLEATISVSMSRYDAESAEAMAAALAEAVEIARLATESYQDIVSLPGDIYAALTEAQQSNECDMNDSLSVVRWLHRQSERQFAQGGSAGYDASAIWIAEQSKAGDDDLYRKGLLFGFEVEGEEV